ncbi:MAG: hypothetical protein KDJ65_08795 [Anaerolineae bacterium]|nr:hypothetical protein [Anaerolineae bacterium]
MTDSTDDTLFYANGINASTGTYGLEPMTEKQLLTAIKGETLLPNTEVNYLDTKNDQVKLREFRKKRAELQAQCSAETNTEKLAEFQAKINKVQEEIDKREHLGVAAHIDPTNLQQTGWGIIFTEKADLVIQEALSELIEWRRPQAGEFFKIFAGDGGYRAGDTYLTFLNRHGAGPGPVDPVKGVPYYLLLVGSPAEIPYQFQYQLDVQYGVGRIHFDTLDEYARYARSVVLAEKGEVRLSRRAGFFGVTNPNDRATALSTKHLIKPLHKTFSKRKEDWTCDLFAGEQATKSQLSQLLGGEQTPALLFTASHGVECTPDDKLQLLHQGALVCQDWEGPEDHTGPLTQDLYFAGDDLTDDTNLLGLMTFHFACYGAGTPQFDEFAGLQKQKKTIAKQPFLAHLPRQLLSHGALAAVGHVERAWGHSFFWTGVGEQLPVFESALEVLLNGAPIGLAVEYFNERYAELATIVNEDLLQFDFLAEEYQLRVPGYWTACADARNYIIVGDPAARLPIAKPEETATDRPDIGEVSFAADPAASTKGSKTTAKADVQAGKPLSTISDEDWHATPITVQQALSEAVALIEQLKTQLDQYPPSDR